jgi:hypothetical protein
VYVCVCVCGGGGGVERGGGAGAAKQRPLHGELLWARVLLLFTHRWVVWGQRDEESKDQPQSVWRGEGVLKVGAGAAKHCRVVASYFGPESCFFSCVYVCVCGGGGVC